MRTRLGTMLVAAVMTAVLGGCTGAQPQSPATPSSAPSVGASVEAAAITPVPAPARVDDIAAGAAVLDGYRSYRLSQTVAQPGGMVRTVVVNGDPHRVRTESLVDGEVAAVTINIGQTTWVSYGGSNFIKEPGMGGHGDTWQNPGASAVDGLVGHLASIEVVGIEDHGGVRTRHLRGTAALAAQSGTGEPGDIPSDFEYGFVGRIDAWLAVDDGHLVALRAAGSQLRSSFDPSEDVEPPPSASPYSAEYVVEGIDDPTNVVDEPALVAATTRPSGDPAAIALVEGIGEGMRGLTTYVIEQTTGAVGMDMKATVTVVNRPVQAAQSVIETGAEGFPGMSILVIGDRAWGRTGDEPWVASSGDNGPTCGQSGQNSSTFKPCTFELMTAAIGQAYAAVADTFRIVATDEVVGGVTCTHLRGEAGMTSGEMTIPGTTDIWIANDGGYLLKDTFDGTGFAISSVTTRVNDPTVVLEPPTP